MSYNIKRVIVQSVVERYVNDIKNDYKRGIRNLLDLGLHFSNGRFQSQFFHASKRLMESEKSMYYGLGAKIANNVSMDVINNFGINLGLNVFTEGAKKIRETEAEEGFNIPWSIIFHVNSETDLDYGLNDIRSTITQGMELGVYAYNIFTEEEGYPVSELCKLLKEFSECAFTVHLMPLTTAENIDEIIECTNCLFSVYLFDGYEDAVSLLGKNGFVCSVTMPYFAENYKDIINESWNTPFVSENCEIVIFIANDNCPEYACKEVRKYIRSTRDSFETPVFLMDFFSDCLLIDEIISDDDCYFGVLNDGTITACEELKEIETKHSIKDMPLKEILRRHKPKAVRAGKIAE